MTTDLARAHRVADALVSGNVWVNSFNILPPGLPLAGPKNLFWTGKFTLHAGFVQRGKISTYHPLTIPPCSDRMRQYVKPLAAEKTALQLFRLDGGIESCSSRACALTTIC